MTTTQAEKRIVSAQIAAEQRFQLERLAAQGDRTLSAEVRRAIVRYLDSSPSLSSQEIPRASSSSLAAPVGGAS